MTITEPVSLAEAKLHLRVEHSDEDGYITALISSAREYAESFTNRLIAPRFDGENESPPEGETVQPATAGEKQAILLLVGHWYAHRESVTSGAMTDVPQSALDLLWFNRSVPV